MKYEIETASGYTVVARNVLELDHDCEKKVIVLRIQNHGFGQCFNFTVTQVEKVTGRGDVEPFGKVLDFVPPKGGAPSSAAFVAGYSGGTTKNYNDVSNGAAFVKEYVDEGHYLDRPRLAVVPPELATTTFAPLESLIDVGVLAEYMSKVPVPKRIPLENVV